jgi:DNA-binding PadR family transcriptional regulator
VTSIRDRFLQLCDRLRTREDRAIIDAMSDEQRWYGYNPSLRTRLRAGRVYPALTRLLDRGLIEDGWDNDLPPGKPRGRRWYRITGPGRYALTMEEQ